ncbi:uncharacterized protein OCT59_009985 [Rhizophagus irregularis]|uniref:uncharacterized protein n=1 Tax=Rhizophagus irregularis TaxID=588596 RepID=UPI00331F0D7D|nr:hypothetical protein OCT59_009985 [Rhizophagus irregularis]
MDDNVDINNNNSEDHNKFIASIISESKNFTASYYDDYSTNSFAPNPVSIAAATSLTGVVNTSFPRGSIQNPITKEEWKQWKKIKQPNEDWKDFLHLPYDTYWTYRLRLNVRTKVKEARIRGIPPPPKRKNITPPNSKRKKLMTNPSTQVSKILSNTVLPAENIETNNTDNIDVQLTHVTPSDVQEELEDTRNVQLYTHETPSNGNEKRTTTTRTRLEKTIRPPKKQSTTRKTYNTRNKSQK